MRGFISNVQRQIERQNNFNGEKLEEGPAYNFGPWPAVPKTATEMMMITMSKKCAFSLKID